MERKMTLSEGLFLVIGFLAFCGGIVCTFFFKPVFPIGLFTVSVVCVLLFAIMSPKGEAELKAAYEKAKDNLEVKEKELSSVKRDLENMTRNALSRESECKELRTKMEELSSKLSEASTEAKSVKKTVLFNEELLKEEEQVNLKEIGQDTIEQLKSFAKEAGIRLSFTCSADSVIYTGSSKLLNIMMRNIVDNAIKYMRRPGNMHITLSDTGEDIFMIFKDDGMGLRADELPYIFDLNFQGSNRVSGNGLGLTQAKDIVNAYDGVIYAKSAPGEGMGIYVQLPKKTVASFAETEIETEAAFETAPEDAPEEEVVNEQE